MPNYTLCIDTSAGTTVAVLKGGETRSEIHFDENMKHAERIGDAIAQAVAGADIAPGRITNVVVGRGPAPFTGLRIGIAAAVMYAEGVGAKLWGVTSLDAIARAAFDAREATGDNVASGLPLLVTADARRSEVYWALYSGLSKSGAPMMIEGPGVAKPAALDELLAEKKFDRTNIKINAADLGKVFEAQLLDGTASQNVTALYLREADAVAPKDLREFGKRVSG
jgi:tRNA threonylcarbamoyl adenosine modification protein YeaZ